MIRRDITFAMACSAAGSGIVDQGCAVGPDFHARQRRKSKDTCPSRWHPGRHRRMSKAAQAQHFVEGSTCPRNGGPVPFRSVEPVDRTGAKSQSRSGSSASGAACRQGKCLMRRKALNSPSISGNFSPSRQKTSCGRFPRAKLRPLLQSLHRARSTCPIRRTCSASTAARWNRSMHRRRAKRSSLRRPTSP